MATNRRAPTVSASPTRPNTNGHVPPAGSLPDHVSQDDLEYFRELAGQRQQAEQMIAAGQQTIAAYLNFEQYLGRKYSIGQGDQFNLQDGSIVRGGAPPAATPPPPPAEAAT